MEWKYQMACYSFCFALILAIISNNNNPENKPIVKIDKNSMGRILSVPDKRLKLPIDSINKTAKKMPLFLCIVLIFWWLYYLFIQAGLDFAIFF